MKLYILILLIAFLFATNAQSATLTVTKTADSNDGICNSDCSLREAITQAANNDVVVFDDLVFSGAATIRVSLGQILISKNISIVGTNAKSLVILATQASGIPLYRAIEFGSASVLISNVTISAVTTPTQTPVDYGGGILNQGDLQLVNVKISGNRASEGGGICNFGILRASNTTITNNTATHANNRGQGGGISNGGKMILTNTTVSGNIATSEQVGIGGIGGGIFHGGSGTATLYNATIAFNQAAGAGGGIYTSSTFIVGNSIVSRNSTDISGIINSQGYNLIGIDPLLNVLSDNGGQTQTHSLHPNSPAIEQGNGTIAGVANDQRGLIRPVDNPAIPNAPGGDGADIGASEREPFVVSVSGRVATPGGRGISGAFLTLTDATGVSRIHPTNPFGYFHFPGVRTGEVSTISVFSKRHRFNPSSRQIAFFANTANTNFVSEN